MSEDTGTPVGAAAHVQLHPGQSLQAACAELARAFAAAGFESPQADARYLVRGVLGLDDAALLRTPEALVGSGAGKLAEAAARRLTHEPVSRILGRRDFYGRRFEVTPHVLDPRPDTETLIEEVLEIVDRNGWRSRPLRIADIGLGSGAILVTLLAELPLALGTGTDVSADALQCAQANAARHGVSGRFEAVETNVLEKVNGAFDIVVSNPPYIPYADIAGLEAGVSNFDPVLALDGGPDGLDVYREIERQVRDLERVSYVVLEVGAGQAKDVARIFLNRNSGQALWLSTVRRDLGGHERCVTLERQSAKGPAKTVGTTGKPI